MVKSPPSNASATTTAFSCISLLLDHPRINPSTNKIFCLPWMSWNTRALRNYFVVLFKGYVLQLIPAHHDIYKSAFCKKATNLGEERKQPELKVILAVLQEMCVSKEEDVEGTGERQSRAQGGCKVELTTSPLGQRDTGPRGDPVSPLRGWLRAKLFLTSLPPWGLWTPSRVLLCVGNDMARLWAILHMLWDVIGTGNQHFSSPHQSSCGKWCCDVSSWLNL